MARMPGTQGRTNPRRTAPTRSDRPELAAAGAELTIDRIGSAGDGVSDEPGAAPVHISRTLPGEQVSVSPSRAGGRARLIEVLKASPARVAAPCPHFAEGCGGCSLQHWDDMPYGAWKRGLVTAALERAGFTDPAVGALHRTLPASRRRMDFAVLRQEGGVSFGLHRAHDRSVIDIVTCAVLHPALFALVAPLRAVMTGLAGLRREGSVIANLLDNGADLLIRTDGPLAPTDRAKLARFAAAFDVPRISWASMTGISEPAAAQTTPFLWFGDVRVEPPPGAFLQASKTSEAAIVAAVLAGLPDRLTGRSRAVELFAGCGTLSFPMAERLRVVAYEGDADAAACVRRAQSGSRVEMNQRDLVRQPLSGKELSGAACIVLDPPHAGAAMQMPAIAASGVERVIYVSCNPAALGRDAGSLAAAGYRLLRASPIDQFLWSAQVECVAVFGR